MLFAMQSLKKKNLVFKVYNINSFDYSFRECIILVSKFKKIKYNYE